MPDARINVRDGEIRVVVTDDLTERQILIDQFQDVLHRDTRYAFRRRNVFSKWTLESAAVLHDESAPKLAYGLTMTVPFPPTAAKRSSPKATPLSALAVALLFTVSQ